MTPLVTALVVGAGGLAALIGAQRRWDRRERHPLVDLAAHSHRRKIPLSDLARGDFTPRPQAIRDPGPPQYVSLVAVQDEITAEFARDPDHAERAAAWDDLRDRMFPPSEQHYWVPNGELPGPDGRWWVFLGVTRTIYGFGERDAATAQAERLNRTEKRGKYHALRRYAE